MFAHDIKIRQADGGYIVTTKRNENVFTSLEKTFEFLLQYYEGRAPTFSGSLYGEVTINRGPIGEEDRANLTLSLRQFQERFFPNEAGKVCPYCGQELHDDQNASWV